MGDCIRTAARIPGEHEKQATREQLNPQPWTLYAISAVQTALIIGCSFGDDADATLKKLMARSRAIGA